jgi:GAF domain-containing protein
MKEGKKTDYTYGSLLVKVRDTMRTSQTTNDKLKAITKLLRDSISYYDWVGFYILDEGKNELFLGPYTGEATEHMRIPVGRGICGQAAEKLEPCIVQDVALEKNYLSCSVRVKAEIVIPIFTNGAIRGELDIDSHTTSPFTEEDKTFLEAVCEIVSELL